MSKRYIWFDLGYTLVYTERERWYEAFLNQQGIHRTLDEIERAYHKTDKLFMREYVGVLGQDGATFFPWYLGVLNYQLGLSFPLHEQAEAMSALRTEMPLDWQPYPFAARVLKQLQQQGFGIGLISNWDLTAREVLERCRLLAYFDHIIVSSEVGMEKPDKRIFEYALNAAGVNPENCCYVGDNYYDDIVGSSQVGMPALLINRYGRFGIEELPQARIISSVLEVVPIVSGEVLQKQA